MRTLRLKVRANSYAWLNAAAKETNLVWNYYNETSTKAIRNYCGTSRWLSSYDLQKLTAGTSALLDYLPSDSIKALADHYVASRRRAKKTRLAWRKSGGSKRSLGWIPFKAAQIKFRDGAIVFCRRRFRVFDSYGLEDFELRAGSFAQDSVGDWFLNVAVSDAAKSVDVPAKAIGIDLGLKAIATTSDGATLEAGRWTARFADRLAAAQRRGHKRQAKRVHRAAARCRLDALHKFSSNLVREYGAIYIGDVSSVRLAKTSMGKSVLDSGWGMLRTMLHYKGHEAGCIVEDIDERFTTQACSSCGAINGPKGRSGLVVREWTCGDCGTPHDRDINAARNILARGLSGPSAGTASRLGGRSSTRLCDDRAKPAPRANAHRSAVERECREWLGRAGS